jgi:hypothetical protein
MVAYGLLDCDRSMSSRSRFPLLPTLAYALVVIAACGGSSVPTSPTPPTPAPPPGTAAPAPAPAPAPQPPPVVTFGPGQHRVGTDVQPGRYYSDPAPGCYWERQSGLGGTAAETIAFAVVDFDAAQWIVEILPTDRGFMTRPPCGTWFSTPRTFVPSSIAPGVWAVGEQIAPGLYQTTASPGCHWERLRDFTGEPGGIIAGDLIGSAGTQFVTVRADDAGFRSEAPCGTWTRAQAAARR